MTPTRPGTYLYQDPIGGPPQLVIVYQEEGQLVAEFEPVAGDEPGEVLVVDMAGDFVPA